MKKISVLLIALLLVASVVSAAAVGNGSLNFYGKIGTGLVSFTVTPEAGVPRIDLVNNESVQFDAAGVLLGEWLFSAVRQSSTPTYTLTYSYPALTIAGSNPIAFEILEYDGDAFVEKADDDTTTWVGVVGDSTVSRDIAVRLLAPVPNDAPASENYSSTITIALTSNL